MAHFRLAKGGKKKEVISVTSRPPPTLLRALTPPQLHPHTVAWNMESEEVRLVKEGGRARGTGEGGQAELRPRAGARTCPWTCGREREEIKTQTVVSNADTRTARLAPCPGSSWPLTTGPVG